MPKSLSTLEIRANLADGLVGFYRGGVAWEGDHVRLALLHKDSKAVMAQISVFGRLGVDACEMKTATLKRLYTCVNRFSQLLSVQLVCLKAAK